MQRYGNHVENTKKLEMKWCVVLGIEAGPRLKPKCTVHALYSKGNNGWMRMLPHALQNIIIQRTLHLR